jgi:hypothetical protein
MESFEEKVLNKLIASLERFDNGLKVLTEKVGLLEFFVRRDRKTNKPNYDSEILKGVEEILSGERWASERKLTRQLSKRGYTLLKPNSAQTILGPKLRALAGEVSWFEVRKVGRQYRYSIAQSDCTIVSQGG